SKFIITLPKKQTGIQAEQVADSEEAFDLTYEAGPDKTRILVAEDTVEFQLLFSETLKSFGFSFDIVSNGELALCQYKKSDYDLILMDCDMPVMDGFEASEAIREIDTDHKTPIIAVSRTILSEDEALYKDAGIDDHLEKPFNPGKLRKSIDKWMNKSTSVKPGMTATVLIIDDDSLMPELIKHTLGSTDLDLDMHALACLDDPTSVTPTLIITDLNMNPYRGEETLRKVEALFPQIPYIVMSGIEPENLADLKSNFNFTSFIIKDRIPTVLENAIREMTG
ncbi:MAG: CheY-like chemotaxis protein, partial [Candidatus Marinamargulisbacteria bacterium]